MKDRSSYVGAFLVTFLVAFVAFVMYFEKVIENTEEIKQQITELLETMNVSNSKLVMLAFSVVTLLIMFFVSFIIYKVIFKIAKCKVNEKKLVITILTSCAVSFAVGYFLFGLIESIVVTIICNVIEALVVIVMSYSEIKGKIGKIVVIKILLIIANVLTTVVV